MGKGGTRFVGDALGARTGRAAGYSSKERKRDMDAFLETGVHPEVKRMREAEALGRPMPPLPPPLKSRPHIFFQFSINRKDAGRVVIELFDDIIPAPVRHFQARCTATARDTFAGTRIHKILAGASVFGGKSSRYTDTVSMKRDATLRHVSAGAVSISADGSEFCLSLAKALPLDDTHQVVGQIVKGIDIVDRISDIPVKATDEPTQVVVVEKCGLTDAEGETDVEVAGGGGGGNGAGASAAEFLEREEDETRNAVQAALEATKKQKEERSAAQRPAKRKSALDAVLLGGSSDDDSDSTDDGE